MLYEAIKKLVQYGIDTGLTPESERIYTTNLILDVMKEDEYEDVDCDLSNIVLEDVLGELLDEAVQIGEAAVSAAEAGATGIMMVFERTSNHPYAVRIAQTDVSNVANLAKDVPECWHDLSDQSVRDEIKQYLLPLMQGELEPIRDKTGLPVFLDIRGIHSTRE